MTPEQKAVVLDYATELQSNDEPWLLFEYCDIDNCWYSCAPNLHPCSGSKKPFRRKPRTITVTMPVPRFLPIPMGINWSLNTEFATEADRDTALAAIREAMGDE